MAHWVPPPPHIVCVASRCGTRKTRERHHQQRLRDHHRRRICVGREGGDEGTYTCLFSDRKERIRVNCDCNNGNDNSSNMRSPTKSCSVGGERETFYYLLFCAVGVCAGCVLVSLLFGINFVGLLSAARPSIRRSFGGDSSLLLPHLLASLPRKPSSLFKAAASAVIPANPESH